MGNRVTCLVIALFTILILTPLPAQVIEWPPVSNADLAMKDYPPAPGVHAVMLLRKHERDDKQGWEARLYRIKVLDEQGKSAGDIETESYFAENTKFTDVEARVIRPDGTIVPYTGPVTDKLVMQYKGTREIAKRFSLPDVQVGSIIEYRYTIKWNNDFNFDSAWLLQESYPTRTAEFSLRYKKSAYLNFTWTYRSLPANAMPKDEDGVVKLALQNIPAAEMEPFMPPSAEIRPRVDFEYRSRFTASIPEAFWNQHAKFWYDAWEYFSQKKKLPQKYVAIWTSPTDPPEVKARKLYDQVQRLRNLSYDPPKTMKEVEQQKLTFNYDVEDVLKHGYGFHNDLVRTYVVLATVAGLDATLVRVVERDTKFHHPEVLDARPYTTELAVVNLNGEEKYLDPGSPYCPFGLLPWEDTDTFGMRLNKEKMLWQKTPQPSPKDSARIRRADLELDSDGTLTGKLTAEFQGRFAVYQRVARALDDDTDKRKSIEEMFKSWLPARTKVELESVDNWTTASDKFVVTAKITMNEYAANTGKRMMLPVLPFADSDQHSLQASKRSFPVYLREPYHTVDEVRVKIPDGMEVETIPQARSIPTDFADLFMTVRREGSTLIMKRQVTIGRYYFPVQQYPLIREFLEKVCLAGEEQAVLHAAGK